MYRFLEIEEAKTVYPVIFKKAFGFWDDRQMPNLVFVREMKGHIVAFIAGYYRSNIEFYFQYLGVVDAKQNRGHGVRFMLDGMEYIKKYKQIRFISCATENTNFTMMKMLLKCRFVPHGVTVSTQKKTYIQWMRELDHG